MTRNARKPKMQIVGAPDGFGDQPPHAKVLNDAGDVLFQEVGPDAWKHAQAFYRTRARLTADDRRSFKAMEDNQ
jgi:hypothetical protein